LASSEFEPAPPVGVSLPCDSIPAAPIGSASTWLSFSLVMIYIALPFFTVAGAAIAHEPGVPETALATRARERSGVNKEAIIVTVNGEW